MRPQIEHSVRDVDDLIPYEFNPRQNEPAVAAVKESIRQFGFLVPVVIDAENVIVTGHTRHQAIKELVDEDPENASYWRAIPVILASHLTDDQLRAFRLIDNKTSELATWDFNLLAQEIGYLHETGVDFQSFGWSQEEVDCLTSVVAADCLTTAAGDAASAPGAENTYGTYVEGESTGRTQSIRETGNGSVRVVFGDLAFFVLKDDYTNWLTGMMRDANYDPTAVIERVAEAMGLLDAKRRRDASVRAGETAPETEEAFGDAAPVPEEQVSVE
ncbi:ParB N-terminal domain-containing protein [Paracoccus sp. MKU1]|uniref:ParB N-terminal domain-containing protein n=1 Tax=Paracoccus sp. MKU1 TaxID=1745182 RepID=UPI000719445D|nr:ParB N-terminal domain-containing protein [Paracoccus sp. MKU1]KRW94282.1 hypothetical protein AQY21_20340 [Paracoccus sp. MKU1]